MSLSVLWDSVKVGTLDMASGEGFYGFTYDPAYLASTNPTPLSHSLPLTPRRFSGNEALPFFEGLLPEGDARIAVARKLGVPSTSSAKLLRALGNDCAGVLRIRDNSEDERSSSTSNRYEPLSKNDLMAIAKHPWQTIVEYQARNRLSLAGAQSKIALFHDNRTALDEGWFLALDDAPSTHILKPTIMTDRYPSLAENELICLRACQRCGISSVEADLLFPEAPLLVVRRYDRVEDSQSKGVVERIHQEDFCQALGIPSMKKYQTDGGPGIADIAEAIMRFSAEPLSDLELFRKLALFNYFVGNCDAHAKNFSLVHHQGGWRLAPAYDLISTTIYDGTFGAGLSRDMGMAMGHHSNIDRITPDDLDLFAKEVKAQPKRIRAVAAELACSLPPALEAAASDLHERGFATAHTVGSRITEGVKRRIEALGL